MGERPGLEAVSEGLVGGGANLVRAPAPEQLRPRPGQAEVRPVELVRRADQHVDSGRCDVDRPVRRVVDGVDPRERAHLVGQGRHALDVHERPERVGRPREGDDARPFGEALREVVQVEPALRVDSDEPDREVEIVRQLEPGRDVGVVIDSGHEDLVARAELPADRAGEREVQRRHVRAEHDLLRLAAQEGGRGVPRLVDHRVGAPAGLEEAAGVRVRLAQVARRSPRSPRPAPASRRARRRTRSAPREPRNGPARPRRRASSRSRDNGICAVRAPSYGTAVRRLRELSEAECYARCYGSGDEGVRVVDDPEHRAVEVRWARLR